MSQVVTMKFMNQLHIFIVYFIYFGSCAIPGLVKRECVMDYLGILYIGDVSQAYDGTECQHWLTKKPINKMEKDLKFGYPNGRRVSGNKCRNPVFKGVLETKDQWCYTVNVKRARMACDVPECPERLRGCTTGHCMEFSGISQRVLISHAMATASGKKPECGSLLHSGFFDEYDDLDIHANHQKSLQMMCFNPKPVKSLMGRITGAWCPIQIYPGTAARYRWAPCEVPLLDDRDTTFKVHYTHHEIGTRLFLFWKLEEPVLRFWLRAWSDYIKAGAALYLLETPGEGEPAVEIIINTHTDESHMCERSVGFVKGHCVTESTFNIVSAEEWREFWVRLDAGMVEFGVADEGRPLLRLRTTEVTNIAYIATANDVLKSGEPTSNTRRHTNMWAFPGSSSSLFTDQDNSGENANCQEFSAVGPAWLSHLFKLKEMSESEKQRYAGDVYLDGKVYPWTDYPNEMYLFADLQIRTTHVEFCIFLSTWPGITEENTVNVKLRFQGQELLIFVHACEPSKYLGQCVEYRRSENPQWLKLDSVKFYRGDKPPMVHFSLTRWTRLVIVSQAKIFRIITFEPDNIRVKESFSYDLAHFGFMSEEKFSDALRYSTSNEKKLYEMYGHRDGVRETFQFRYIGFGTHGGPNGRPMISYIRLNCIQPDKTPLTTFPNCLPDAGLISAQTFKGTWSVTESGEQCTAWSSVQDGWRLIDNKQLPQTGLYKQMDRYSLSQSVITMVEGLRSGKYSATEMDMSNNCRNWPGIQGTVCFVKRHGKIKPSEYQRRHGAKNLLSQSGYWDVPHTCQPAVCLYRECRGSFSGVTYGGNQNHTGFRAGEVCAASSSIRNWQHRGWGDANLCRNDEARSYLKADRPFCLVRPVLDGTPVPRYCSSVRVCSELPKHHFTHGNKEIRIILHASMSHYIHLGVRASTPTIMEFGALLCYTDMIWDISGDGTCIYVGSNFLMGAALTFSAKISVDEGWVAALQYVHMTEIVSRDLSRDSESQQIDGYIENWYWTKFDRDAVYLGRRGSTAVLLTVPRIRGDPKRTKSFKNFFIYAAKIQAGIETLPYETQTAPEANSNSKHSDFRALLLLGNRIHQTFFMFPEDKLKNLCPVFGFTPGEPGELFSLNRRHELRPTVVESVAQFHVRFTSPQTPSGDDPVQLTVLLQESATIDKLGFVVYSVVISSECTGPKCNRIAYRVSVKSSRPGLERTSDTSALHGGQMSTQLGEPVLLPHLVDLADSNWHALLIRVTCSSEKSTSTYCRVAVESSEGDAEFGTVFEGEVHDPLLVGDVRYAAFEVSHSAYVMWDLLGDYCQPPKPAEFIPKHRDGGWGMWSPWSCSVECDGGFGMRQRACDNPAPSLWGADCPSWNIPKQYGLCNNHKCGTFSELTRIKILHALASHPVAIDVEEGDEFTLKCGTAAYQAAIDQFPLASTRWLLNGENWRRDPDVAILSGVDVTVINASSTEHTGVYSCQVSVGDDEDIVGATVLVALVSVIVRTANVTRLVENGDKVEFDCRGEILDQVYDNLIHMWYLDGELYSYMGSRIFSDENNTHLVIPDRSDNQSELPLIAIEDIRLERSWHRRVNTMKMRVASRKLSGEWECVVFQPNYTLIWITNWFRLEVRPYRSYHTVSYSPVAAELLGHVNWPLTAAILSLLLLTAMFTALIHCVVGRQQKTVDLQMTLFRRAGVLTDPDASAETLISPSSDQLASEDESSTALGYIESDETVIPSTDDVVPDSSSIHNGSLLEEAGFSSEEQSLTSPQFQL